MCLSLVLGDPGFGVFLQEASYDSEHGFASRAELQMENSLCLSFEVRVRPPPRCHPQATALTLGGPPSTCHPLGPTAFFPPHDRLSPCSGVETSLIHSRSHACWSLHVSFFFSIANGFLTT